MSVAQDELAPLTSALAALQRLIERFDSRGVIIGGVAASVLGRPRFTADADAILLLDIADVPTLVEEVRRLGLNPVFLMSRLSHTRPG